MDNATKALISGFISSLLTLLLAFGIQLSTEQVAAIMAVVNTGLGLFVFLTRKSSPRWILDPPKEPPVQP